MPADRVSVTFGQKIQVTQYEPVNIEISYATDCKLGETPQQAALRAKAFVETQMKPEINKLMRVKRKNIKSHKEG
jgi:hypothetical protein